MRYVRCVNQALVVWTNERLVSEDTGAKLDGHSIQEISELRRKKHFAAKAGTSYALLEAAWYIICAASYQPAKERKDIQRRYISGNYQIDAWYRAFIRNLDLLENASAYGQAASDVHGGSCPQEMIVPVLDIKMDRYHMETHTVQIVLLSLVQFRR